MKSSSHFMHSGMIEVKHMKTYKVKIMVSTAIAHFCVKIDGEKTNMWDHLEVTVFESTEIIFNQSGHQRKTLNNKQFIST